MRYFLLSFTIALLFFSCNKDEFETSKSVKLTYSMDTVYFDTIFTTIGSRTKELMIYNGNDAAIKISNIHFGKGTEYIINIDGVSGDNQSDIEIGAHDSIFVFVQAKMAENGVDTLIVHEDSIVVEYNGNTDAVKIFSWGQDVTQLHGASVNTETWTSQKPYLVFDSLVINEGQTLTLGAGVRIYFRFGANLIVKGNLIIEGTKDNPVWFLPDWYEHRRWIIPGQWGSILIRGTSVSNSINYAIIKNGVSGFILDKTDHRIDLKLSNTRIENMSYIGIFSENSHISATNCVIANCAEYCAFLVGGNNSFVHCTFANVTNNSGNIRKTPSVLITDYMYYSADEEQLVLDSAYFGNCIIMGTHQSEIGFKLKYDDSVNCKIESSLVVWNESKEDKYKTHYFTDHTVYDKDSSLFLNEDLNFFQLDTLSQAMNRGSITVTGSLILDIEGNNRTSDGKPDCGAYEYFFVAPEN